MSAEVIAVALGGHKPNSTGSFMACCPAHDDKNPSLSLDVKDGKLLWRCHAGCSQEKVYQGFLDKGLKNLVDSFNTDSHLVAGVAPEKPYWAPITPVPADAPEPPIAHYTLGKPTFNWGYHDTQGELLQYVYRFETDEGKQIRPVAYCTNNDKNEWRWQGLPAPRPLYGLQLLSRSQEVLIVEGEKCADAAFKLLDKSIAVVTWMGGCGSVAKTDWSPTKGKQVVIWPDADDPGRKAAVQVAQACLAIGAASVKIVDPPANVPEGWDLADAEEDIDWDRYHVENAMNNAKEFKSTRKIAGNDQDVVQFASESPSTQETETSPQVGSVLPYEDKEKAVVEGDAGQASPEEKTSVRGGKRQGINLDDMESWPEPVDLSGVLNEIVGTIKRFIICDLNTSIAATLWIAMTWFIDVVSVAPLAVITAPEKRCGKTQLLTLFGKLVRKPLTASNITPAALFRTIDKWEPTFLIDEADAFMRDNEELRGLLNAGHTRDSAFIIRTVGNDHAPKQFNVWGAKALSGIGRLPDTVMDRSINLKMRRKLLEEKIDRLRYAEKGLFENLAAKLARAAEDFQYAVEAARPNLPEQLNDRQQDNWEPLFAIAEVAGGEWPNLTTQAALDMSSADEPHQGVVIELLADIQEIFENKGIDRISTKELILTLCEDDEQPWSTYNRGKSITPRQVASRLKEYGISSRSIRKRDGSTPKGFLLEQFQDAFARYLSFSEKSATTPQPPFYADLSVADDKPRCATANESATDKSPNYAGCGVVADKYQHDEEEVVEISEDIIEQAGWF